LAICPSHVLFDRGRTEDLAAARTALEDATTNGPRTAWFRRLERTVAALNGHERTADDTDRLFLVWDEWRREAGGRLDRALSDGRSLLAGSHDQQCEGLKVLARLVGATGERPPKTEQSATDCRWSWSTVKRGERRVWEVKTGEPHPVSRGDVNQLLGQIEVEAKRAAQDTGLRLPAGPGHYRQGRRRPGRPRQDHADQSRRCHPAIQPVGRSASAVRRDLRRRQRRGPQ
jgi:hypothetical protein